MTRLHPAPAARLAAALAALVSCLFLTTATCARAACPPQDAALRPLVFGDPEGRAAPPPFFAGSSYDPGVTSPDTVLGQPQGSRLARHAEILECFRQLAATSPRVRLLEHGRSFEGRPLVHAVITSPAHHARLDAILADLAALADPRGLSEAEAERIVGQSPATAWLGYSIHGDELSGCDAAVALAHHLAASTDADVAELLEAVVVVIDPCMNPDGRERILGMVEQSSGHVPNLDYDSMQRGRWPWGRGNHYLFDMNRDWMTGSQPETRARWQAVQRYHPALFVDAHEMGALDTYLFYPQAAPHNPYLPERLGAWQQRFGADQAAAFDARGWVYYTREWADAWAPFYSDAWGSLGGAVGILYEQAGTSGFPLRLASGQVRTYREAVHHQAVSSLANLTTLARERGALLADQLAHARAAIAPQGPDADRVFVLLPGRQPTRERALVDDLLAQGVEVWRTTAHLALHEADDGRGTRADALDAPPGSYLVPARQPLRARVLSMLSFDIRIDEESLRKERLDLETKGTSRLYDVTAWSPALLGDLDVRWARGEVAGERLTALEPAAAGLEGDSADTVAWLVDGMDDASVAFAARALEAGLVLHVADEPFRSAGRSFARGSLLVRRADNPEGAAVGAGAGGGSSAAGTTAARVAAAARAAGAVAYATTSARSPDDGPDLGGGHFVQLARPRVALLSNMPVAPDAFGHLWYQLDQVLGLPVSFLDAQTLPAYDLRRFNVLVVPPGFELEPVLSAHLDALRNWVQGGGTLVACGNAAATLAGLELGSVVRRGDVLEELDGYAFAARREAQARDIELDLAALWGESEAAAPPGGADGAASPDAAAGDDDGDADEDGAAASASDDDSDDSDDDSDEPDPTRDPDAERQEQWMRRFAPAGAILRGLVDERHWITAGCTGELPVLVDGAEVLLARAPVRTAVRLAPADALRLSGLLWPEARERLADAAWLTVESLGRGQIILCASNPGFRAQFPAGARLFSNAVVYGPGAGAQQPIGW